MSLLDFFIRYHDFINSCDNNTFLCFYAGWLLYARSYDRCISKQAKMGQMKWSESLGLGDYKAQIYFGSNFGYLYKTYFFADI